MKTLLLSDLVAHLERRIVPDDLMIQLPLRGWSFSSDNVSSVHMLCTLRDPEAIIVKQFTNEPSTIPLASDPTKFIPMKRVASVFYPGTPQAPLLLLPAHATRESYSKDPETGSIFAPPADMEFVDLEMIMAQRLLH